MKIHVFKRDPFFSTAKKGVDISFANFTLCEQLRRAILLELRKTHVILLTVLRFSREKERHFNRKSYSTSYNGNSYKLEERASTREHSYFEQFFTALVTMLVLSHHPTYVHVHFVIDLGREIAIVHRVSAVA